jgi:chromosome segregation ATPase
MMGLTLQEAKEKLMRRKKDLEITEGFLPDLKQRAKEAEEVLVDLKVNLGHLQGQKQELLKLVVEKKASQDDIVSIDSQIADLQGKIKAQEAIAEHLKKAIPGEEEKIRKLKELYQGAKHEFWYAVSMHELKKSKPPEAILRAWVATHHAGLHETFGRFLNRHMKWDVLSFDEVEELKKTLLKEYLQEELQGTQKKGERKNG